MRIRYLKSREILWLLGMLFLAGCGFHLKGFQQSSPVLDGIYIEGGESRRTLAGQLKQELMLSGSQVMSSPEEARFVVRIKRENFTQKVVSVDSNGKVLEYALTLETEFSVTNRAGEEVMANQKLAQTHQLVFSGDDELGRRAEAEILNSDLRQELAGRIIRRLEAQLK